jgi:erythromycin esterase-like protein
MGAEASMASNDMVLTPEGKAVAFQPSRSSCAGLTAIAMDTGLAETRRLEVYVAGGPGDPVDLMRTDFGWNFNLFVSNVELIRWLREWNDTHPGHGVRLYGIDTSGGFGDARMGRAGIVLDHLIDYLSRITPVAAREVVTRLTEFKGRFSDQAYARYTAEERHRLTSALAEAQTLFATERATMIAASSPEGLLRRTRSARLPHVGADVQRLAVRRRQDPSGARRL